MVRVSGYRYRGLGFDPRRYQIFWVVVGLEQGQPREPREVNWGAIWMKKVAASGLEKKRLTAVGTRCADHVTPLYPQKLALTSPTGGGRSVGIVRVRTKAMEFSFSCSLTPGTGNDLSVLKVWNISLLSRKSFCILRRKCFYILGHVRQWVLVGWLLQ